MAGSVCWVDLPAKNLARAIKFYETVLKTKATRIDDEAGSYAYFGHVEKGDVGACLVETKDMTPREDGLRIYFDVEGRLAEAESLVEAAGGSIKQKMHSIGEHGNRSIIIDTEGNQIALHSMS